MLRLYADFQKRNSSGLSVTEMGGIWRIHSCVGCRLRQRRWPTRLPTPVDFAPFRHHHLDRDWTRQFELSADRTFSLDYRCLRNWCRDFGLLLAQRRTQNGSQLQWTISAGGTVTFSCHWLFEVRLVARPLLRFGRLWPAKRHGHHL